MIIENIDKLYSALAAHNRATEAIMKGLANLSKSQRSLNKDSMPAQMKTNLVDIAKESLKDIDFASYATTGTEARRIFQATVPEPTETE